MADPMRLNRRSPGTAVAKGDKRRQYLTFMLGGESFALEIRCIREIIQYGGITEVPLMPPFIRGVINLRGFVVPVVDLSVRFGRPQTEVGKKTCFVILEVEQEDTEIFLGIMVDNVSEVVDLAESDIEPPPSFGHGLRSDFISGVGKIGGRFVILLDVQHVLSVGEMADLAGGLPTETPTA